MVDIVKEIEKMEQWHSMLTLSGFDIDNLEDDWTAVEDGVLENLYKIEEYNELVEKPTKAFSFALTTVDMGVTSEEILAYQDHIYALAKLREAREAQERILATPMIVELIEKHQFRYVTGTRFPKHKHFEFNTSAGVAVHGRVFRPAWNMVRVWIEWTDGSNKKHKQKWDARHSDIRLPAGSPEDWESMRWGHTSDINEVPYIIANYIVHRTLPPVAKHLYPKK